MGKDGYYYYKFIIVSFYFILVFFLAIYNYIKPYYSYDLVPYVAATISLREISPEKIHTDTYTIVKETIPRDIFNQFISGEFGKQMYTDAISFNQQLNYYKVKPLYIYFIFMLHRFGLGIVKSINFISAFSFVGISILLFLFLNKLKSGYLGLIILSLLMICQPFVLLAGRNTPDTLSAFFIMFALYIMINTNVRYLGCIFLILSIAIRPDNLIIAGALLFYFGFLSTKEYRLKLSQTFSFIFLSIIAYFSINKLEHSYGWKTQFTISFLHTIYRPAETIVHLSVQDYFRVLIKNGISILNTHIVYFIIFGLLGIVLTFINKEKSIFKDLIMISIAIMIFYFMLFPSTEVDRYFNTEYLMISILTLQITCNKYLSLEKSKNEISFSGKQSETIELNK